MVKNPQLLRKNYWDNKYVPTLNIIRFVIAVAFLCRILSPPQYVTHRPSVPGVAGRQGPGEGHSQGQQGLQVRQDAGVPGEDGNKDKLAKCFQNNTGKPC